MSSTDVSLTEYGTTVDDVRKHLHMDGWDTEGIADPQIEFYIEERANLIVSEDLAGTDQSDRRLRVIEALLAGHYILDSGIDKLRQGERDQSSGGAYTWYAGEFGPGLMSTTLGQQAIEFDRSGVLQDMVASDDDETGPPGFRSLGSPTRSQY